MITDIELNEIGKALNNESYSVANYMAVGSTIITALSSDTTLLGEYRRVSVTKTRSNNSVNHNVFLSGTGITSTSGNYIYSLGLLSQSTSGLLLSEIGIPGLLQTTAFDIEVDWTLTVNRA